MATISRRVSSFLNRRARQSRLFIVAPSIPPISAGIDASLAWLVLALQGRPDEPCPKRCRIAAILHAGQGGWLD
jgi:hypothetical protein